MRRIGQEYRGLHTFGYLARLFGSPSSQLVALFSGEVDTLAEIESSGK